MGQAKYGKNEALDKMVDLHQERFRARRDAENRKRSDVTQFEDVISALHDIANEFSISPALRSRFVVIRCAMENLGFDDNSVNAYFMKRIFKI